MPVRQNKALLEQPGAIERLLKMEQELSRDPPPRPGRGICRSWRGSVAVGKQQTKDMI